MPERPIYLDNHATTRTDPRVLDAIWPYFTDRYGNAGSVGHRYGWDAADAVEHAREQVAGLVGGTADGVVFTSGATESNNLALRGALPGLRTRGDHVVVSNVEHKSVLETARHLGRAGWRVGVAKADGYGRVTPDAVAEVVEDRTVLVSVIAAGNEVGTVNPVAEIAAFCRSRGIAFHTDATQAVGKVPFDAAAVGADLVSLSAHKFYGPKGVGALYVRRGGPVALRLSPSLTGGGQERGLRSGTVAVPLVVGLGAASEIAGLELPGEGPRLARLRDRLEAGLLERLDGVTVNGRPERRLPGNANLSFDGIDGERLMTAMTEVAVSAGAACSAANPEPSHVLRAIGRTDAQARASLRFGLGRFTTEAEVDFAVGYVVDAVTRLRGRGSAGRNAAAAPAGRAGPSR